MSSRDVVDLFFRRLKSSLKVSAAAEARIREALEFALNSLLGPSGGRQALPSGGNAGIDPKTLALVASREAAARALRLLRDFGPMYTRQLLGHLRGWENGHEVIELLARLGLIRRVRDQCTHDRRRVCIYNYITETGLRVLEFIESSLEG